MATATAVSLDEYMRTSYRPDREYIDGEVRERNVGKWEHARIQVLLAAWFAEHETQWNVYTAVEWRTQVSPTRVRIPDVVVVQREPQTPVLQKPALLVVEILSPDDTYSETERRAADYLKMGVKTIWLIDPETRTGKICTAEGWQAETYLSVAGTGIYVELNKLFAALEG